MKKYKSEEPNTFHYVTSVTHHRLPIFRSQKACELFVSVLQEVRERKPYKLIGYVIMPDHFHLIVNPLDSKISKWLLRVRGLSARGIIGWLKEEKHFQSLEKLRMKNPQKRNHLYAVWQPNPFVVDLFSHKFLRQKLNYIHLNPVWAGLCQHPAEWKWSSYRAYLPHEAGEVPIEIDWQAYWTDEEMIGEKSTGGGR